MLFFTGEAAYQVLPPFSAEVMWGGGGGVSGRVRGQEVATPRTVWGDPCSK